MAAAAQSLPRDLIKSISFLGLLRQIFDDFATSWLSILFCNCICGARKITLGPEGTCVKFTLCECFHRVGVCILVLSLEIWSATHLSFPVLPPATILLPKTNIQLVLRLTSTNCRFSMFEQFGRRIQTRKLQIVSIPLGQILG